MKPSAPHAVFPIRSAAVGAIGAFPINPDPIVAHQGGWDEILMVVAPLALIGGLLWLANRRVTAQLNEDDGSRSSGGDGQD